MPDAEPPPGPDPRRVLQEGGRFEPRPGATPPGPQGDGEWRRPSVLVIVLAGVALGLGVATAVLVARGPEEKFITTTDTKRVQPTTTTTDTTIVTTVVSTITTTNRTVTETQTETVTEQGPPGGGNRRGKNGGG